MARHIRYDWTLKEVRDIYNQPLLDLVYQASDVHRHFHLNVRLNFPFYDQPWLEPSAAL